eukprot:comp11474_c0_seq1/m.5917 comp11474_c0_seq1/g.5917  ORF comp11474_c0_seq1/g.5917 comp11474_c0_seq1/m.5917 type:complete len:246 (-) comp11474_c0_seq1:321-1058(-)
MTTRNSDECCDVMAAKSTPTGGDGDVITLPSGLKLYVSGAPSANGVLVIYDIFGFDMDGTRRVCDELAQAGFTVCMADVFHHQPWDANDFPPKDGQHFMTWIRSWTFDRIKDDLQYAVEYLKNKGCENIGAIGFCWGGRMALYATTSSELGLKGSVVCHPAEVPVEVANDSKCPILVLPAQEDKTHQEHCDIINKKGFAVESRSHQFKDKPHGFIPRGDRSDPDTVKAQNEAVGMAIDFLKRVCA